MKPKHYINNSRRVYSPKWYLLNGKNPHYGKSAPIGMRKNHDHFNHLMGTIYNICLKAFVFVFDNSYSIDCQLCREDGIIPLLQGRYGLFFEDFSPVETKQYTVS